MSELIFKIEDDGTVEVKTESELDYSEALGLCIDGFEALIAHGVSQLSEDIDAINHLHDYISYALTSVIGRVFPEEEQFSFTDAAIYKAQNDLLEESMEQGVPIEELIQKYNDQAEDYINNIREN